MPCLWPQMSLATEVKAQQQATGLQRTMPSLCLMNLVASVYSAKDCCSCSIWKKNCIRDTWCVSARNRRVHCCRKLSGKTEPDTVDCSQMRR